MYGPPPNVNALRGYFELQDSRADWQTYMADMTWAVAKALKPKLNVPLYSEMLKKPHVTDTRTGAEILAHVKGKFRELLVARGVKKQNETV